MQLTLAIVSCNQTLFDRTAWHAAHYASGGDSNLGYVTAINLVGIGNGVQLRPDPCVSGFKKHIIRSLQANEGIPAAMHKLWQMAQEFDVPPEEHLIAYLHDDLIVLERNWDARVCTTFISDPDAVLAGFSGTKGLGHSDIYKEPYHLTQLSRQGPLLSNLYLHAEFHGERTTETQPVAFVDGFSLILRQSFLDVIDGWSWWPKECVHHAYDYGIACQAKRSGGSVWLVPVDCDHGVQDPVNHGRSAGTSGSNHYQKLAATYGGDAAVHAASHRFVYDEFKDVLPIRVQ